MQHSDDPAKLGGSRSLLAPSFLGLLLTQLLTAINDNVFRWLVIGVGKDYVEGDVGGILMAGTACFVLPYLLLAAPAGYLADRFSKRNVIVTCKVAEIFIMGLGVAAIYFEVLWLLFMAVALMGAQSALFSPSKLGSIPEILHAEKISSANGLFGLCTVGATVIGMALGGWLSDQGGFRGTENLGTTAAALLGIAIVGTALSLLIGRLPAAAPNRRFPWDAVSQTVRDLRTLAAERPMLRVALGIVFFWSLGALAQLNIDQLSAESGGLYESDRTPLLICLVAGLGVGAVLAGIWSAGRVELGILPLGAFGVALFSMLLFTVQETIIEPQLAITPGMIWACTLLALLGASAGLFSVPLEAFMQHRSPVQSRGAILAASNFMTFTGILLAAIAFRGMRLPVFSGSLDNVSATLLGQPLSPDDAARVDTVASNYRSRWNEVIEAAAENQPKETASDDPLDPNNAVLTMRPSNAVGWALQPDQPTRAADTPARQPTASSSRPAPLPELDDFLIALPPRLQTAAFARLLWIEIESRQRLKSVSELPVTLPLDRYFERFPDYNPALTKAVYEQATGLPMLTSRQIFLVLGLGTIPVLLYIVWLIPQSSVRFLVWLASRTVYRIRVRGRENLPERGGALLVANHVSWLDGVLLLLTSSRPIRIIVWSGNFQSRWSRWWARQWGAILLGLRPKEIQQALQTAREALLNGELVCIFPEGGITRSGQLQTFRPGLMRILEGAPAPVIPVYLDELWGSIFSFHGGKFLWKWPRKWPYPISILFGPAIEHPEDVHQVRRAVQDLGAIAVQQRTPRMKIVSRDMLRICKKRLRGSKVVDSSGSDLGGGQLLTRTLVLRRLLRRHVIASAESYVGVLLPPSVGGVVVNAALTLDRRIAVNLNYTVNEDVMNQCLARADIRHILTSRRFVEKLSDKFDFGRLKAEIVYLEDFKDKPTLTDKLLSATAAYAVPASWLARWLKLHRVKADDPLTVIFTSGSTGEPKGVVLSYANVASNIEAIEQVVQLRDTDVLLGILPFFHSFGFTITLWTVLSLDIKGVYHFNPLDAKQIGKLCQKYKGTLLLSTPTFLRSYIKRCDPAELSTLEVVVAGAEKLPVAVADAFEKKFGTRPVEGYGATELSPLATVNVPPKRSHSMGEVDAKEGTVGRPVPGVSARVTDLDSGAVLGPQQAGMLWITGPNVMQGYLGRPEATEKVIQDGWYMTGDVGHIDEDGFVTITGRESRFSKIGGEMVPHIEIEEKLAEVIGAPEEDGLKAAVTSLPDARKGERLIVLYTDPALSPAEMRQRLLDAGLPNLYVPAADNFRLVDELPMLGTGKLDLKKLRQMAEQLFAGDENGE